MTLNQAIQCLYNGFKVKLPEWEGYWFVEDGLIKVFTKDGEITDTPWFKKYVDRDDFRIAGNNKKYENLSFGITIELLKEGFPMQRKGWNGKGLFVIKQKPTHVTKDIVPNMSSLPNNAKKIILSRENPVLDYTNQMIIIHPDGRADSWVPSVSDIFATDWQLYNY